MITKTKRLVLPRTIKIARKTHFWGASASPGKHDREHSIPLLILLRDYLHLGDKEREIARMLANRQVAVDGKVVREKRFGVGFMDVVSILPTGEHFRITYDTLGRLVPVRIEEGEAQIKPLRIKGKRSIDNSRFQITFHDGRNMITQDKDLRPGDVVIFDLKSRSVVEKLKFQPGNRAFLTGGSHVGEIGTIKKIEVKESSHANLVHFEEGFSTVQDYAFVISSPKYSFNIKVQGGAQS